MPLTRILESMIGITTIVKFTVILKEMKGKIAFKKDAEITVV